MTTAQGVFCRPPVADVKIGAHSLSLSLSIKSLLWTMILNTDSSWGPGGHSHVNTRPNGMEGNLQGLSKSAKAPADPQNKYRLFLQMCLPAPTRDPNLRP